MQNNSLKFINFIITPCDNIDIARNLYLNWSGSCNILTLSNIESSLCSGTEEILVDSGIIIEHIRTGNEVINEIKSVNKNLNTTNLLSGELKGDYGVIEEYDIKLILSDAIDTTGSFEIDIDSINKAGENNFIPVSPNYHWPILAYGKKIPFVFKLSFDLKIMIKIRNFGVDISELQNHFNKKFSNKSYNLK